MDPKTRRWRTALMAACLFGLAAAATSAAWAQPPDPNIGAEPAPQPRPGYGPLVERQSAGAHAKPVDLLFVGDSITAIWMRAGRQPAGDVRAVWDRWYGDRHAFDLGVGGDQTQNVLWRLAQGEVDGLHPRLIVLLIGTNNLAFQQTPEQTARGVQAVVLDLHRRLPGAHILLLGLLPRGLPRAAADLTAEIGEVNALLAREAGAWPFATYLDIGQVMLRDGQPDPALYMDSDKPRRRLLHPNALGAERIARAIEPDVARWLGDRSRLGR